MWHYAKRSRGGRRNVRRLALVLLAVGMWGSVQRLDAQKPRRRHVEGRPYTAADGKRVPVATPEAVAADRRDLERREQVVNRLRSVSSYLGRLPFDVPEYHDEQPLSSGPGTTYGPVAYLMASPYLGGFKTIQQINGSGPFGVLVAVVYVEQSTAPLPKAYTDLHLAAGLNCVYLANTGHDPLTGWVPYITAGSEATGCPRPTTLPPPDLDVQVSRHTTKPPPPDEDYPGVARFDEDNNYRPLIGVRCLNAWCEIGPRGFTPRPPSHSANTFLMKSREGRVKGWHDDQLLAVTDLSGALVPGIRATATPSRDLLSLSLDDFTNQWVRVATIFIADDPTNTKYGRKPSPGSPGWGMQQGLNVLELAYVGGQWRAQVTAADNSGNLLGGATPTPLFIKQEHHYDTFVPGTARFRWRSTDDDLWVYCDQGCCRVSAFAFAP